MPLAPRMGRSRAAAEGCAGGAASSSTGAWVPRDAPVDRNLEEMDPEAVDPDVFELCKHFDIKPQKMAQLHNIMLLRASTFESDILKLWDSFKNAREPNAVITRKMQEMKEGTFIGKAPKSFRHLKPMRDFFKKHKIDNLSKDSLSDALHHRQHIILTERKRRGAKDGERLFEKDMDEVLERLDRDLTESWKPSALVMRDIPAIETGTGRWAGIGRMDEAKRGDVRREASPEPEAPPPPEAEPGRPPPPPGAGKKEKPPPPPGAGRKKEKQPPQVPSGGAKPFDPAELAARLRATAAGGGGGPLAEAPPPALEPATAPPAPAPLQVPTPAPAAPVLAQDFPTAPAPAPAPEAASKGKVLPLRLSATSKERIMNAKEELPRSKDADRRPKQGPGGGAGGRSGVEAELADKSELELCMLATGKSMEELQGLSKAQVRALVLQIAGGGAAAKDRSSSSSSSPSPPRGPPRAGARGAPPPEPARNGADDRPTRRASRTPPAARRSRSPPRQPGGGPAEGGGRGASPRRPARSPSRDRGAPPRRSSRGRSRGRRSATPRGRSRSRGRAGRGR